MDAFAQAEGIIAASTAQKETLMLKASSIREEGAILQAEADSYYS